MHEWVNQDIIELMKRRDKLRIKIIKFREQDLSTNAISNELRHIRNQINIMIRQRKEHYMNEKIESCGNYNTTLLIALSDVVPIKATVKKSQNEMTSKLSANELNKFITEEPQNKVNNNIPNNTSTQWKKSKRKVFSIPIVTENRASLLINELCPKKATGSDGILVVI
jgi:hypothetical protein